MMLNTFLDRRTLLVLTASGAMMPLMFSPYRAVSAQGCVPPAEAITHLYQPEPGARVTWSALYGKKGYRAKLESVIGLPGGRAIAAGQVWRNADGLPALVLVAYDRRGEVLWTRTHAVPFLRNVVGLMSDGEGYAVLMNQKAQKEHGRAWFGFFDKNGKLKTHRLIGESARDVYAEDIQPIDENKGWVVSLDIAHPSNSNRENAQHVASVMTLKPSGEKESERSYILGQETHISRLSVLKLDEGESGYIATGYFENNEGKKIGWVLRLNPDLSMIWQKEFSRGDSAHVTMAAVSQKEGVLVAGNVQAADSEAGGVWLARLDPQDGRTLWQRYYAAETSAYSYRVRSLEANEDGTIALLLAADPTESVRPDPMEPEQKDMTGFGIPEGIAYGHLLRLDSRGFILSGEAFYRRQDVVFEQMKKAPDGYRAMAGYTFVPSVEEGPPPSYEELYTEEKLHEPGDVTLPDAPMTEKTQKGLALLRGKIAAQEKAESGEENDQKRRDESHHAVPDDSAKMVSEEAFVQKGWVVMGDPPAPYNDPCNVK